MDLKQLRHFVAVVEHGNILRAAGAINISQPALSKSIQKLEASVEAPLLERTIRGVTPTLFGETLFKHAKLILSQAQQALEEIGSFQEGFKGHIKIGLGASFAGFMLPEAVINLLKKRPDITFSVVSKPYEELIPMLEQGELDAVMALFPPNPLNRDLCYEPLIASDFRTICRAEHPLAKKKKTTLQDLADHEWVLFDRPQAAKILHAQIFTDADIPAPRPVIETSSVFFLKATLMQGDFLSFVPPGLVMEELNSGRLKTLEADVPPFRMKAGIIYRSTGVQQTTTTAIIEEIRSIRDKLDPLIGAQTVSS
ncbi:MAG: LysR family transcriptional regulator [Rhodospirillales bacterium]|nr:LysR family transcriptional regulator [Rhodospirillales bacterium]